MPFTQTKQESYHCERCGVELDRGFVCQICERNQRNREGTKLLSERLHVIERELQQIIDSGHGDFKPEMEAELQTCAVWMAKAARFMEQEEL